MRKKLMDTVWPAIQFVQLERFDELDNILCMASGIDIHWYGLVDTSWKDFYMFFIYGGCSIFTHEILYTETNIVLFYWNWSSYRSFPMLLFAMKSHEVLQDLPPDALWSEFQWCYKTGYNTVYNLYFIYILWTISFLYFEQ